jgi:hypothetical protein
MKSRANGSLLTYGVYNGENKKSQNNLDNLAIPEALVAYYNRLLYSSYLFLECQLSKVDCTDSETYERLNTITQNVFDTWVSLGYREGGELNSGCL